MLSPQIETLPAARVHIENSETIVYARPQPWIANSGLISWWDMEKFAAENFCNACGNLTSIAYLAANNPADARGLRLLSERLVDLQSECESLGLKVSALQCATMIETFDNFSKNDLVAGMIKPVQITQALTDIRSVISNEMKTHLFLSVFPNRQDFYEQPELFGAKVSTNFASAKEDIKESGCCYATDRTTACVMHLMRVLEVGLNTLAKELNVIFSQRNWENVINDIEAEIKKINGPAWGVGWKQNQQFYSGAAKDFRYFKVAWRNHAMHYRERYDADEAKIILEHVKAFMVQLADGGLKE